MPPVPEPYRIHVPDTVLTDLRERLARTRFAPDERNEDWTYGVNGAYLRGLVDYWLNGYDWRAQEAAMNALPQFKVEVDGAPIHFFHLRGQGPAPMPLVLTHGWPWTSWDFQKVMKPLADPGAFGGDPADAFDVVVPALPGYGFSSPYTLDGNPLPVVAELWRRLMVDVLGYERFAAAGGDWGTLITQHIGHAYYPGPVIGVHLFLSSFIGVPPGRPTAEDWGPEDVNTFAYQEDRLFRSVAHRAVNANRPLSYAHAMHDSPAGLLSWLLDKRREWGDCGGDVESRFSRDDLITTAMIYWVTETLATSIRYYAERQLHPWTPVREGLPIVTAPTGVAAFPNDVIVQPKRIAAEFTNLKRWTPMPSGGHFAPMEEPALLVDDIRAHFRTLR